MDKEFLQILACPLCHAAVSMEGQSLVCQACGHRYPVKDGIPIMVIEDSGTSAKTARSGDERE